MRSFWTKLGLFLCLWYETAAELRLDADRSFLLSVVIVCFGWWALRMSGQFIGILGPSIQRLLVGSLVWLGLFWWFAPAILKGQPMALILAGALAIAVVGAQCRHEFAWRSRQFDKSWLRERSHTVAPALVLGLALTFWCVQRWVAVWPVIGYALLLGLPLAFGWQMAGRVGPPRSDARFGQERAFRDAGFSKDR